MPLLNSIFSWLTVKRVEQINLYNTYPIELQKETLSKLLEMAQDTEWGKKYDYSSIDRTSQYSERFPLQDYESLKPYINKVRKGEQNILWPTPIKWFAKSSGTTQDKSKFIPVSKEALEENHFRGSKDVLALYSSLNPESRIFRGRGLVLGGSHQISSLNMDSFYGDLSAILLQNSPFWVNFIRTPELSIALMDEWESKMLKMAETTSKVDVTSMAGVPSWTMVLINKVVEYTKANNILEVWPNLELFIHGGVSFVPYRKQFEKLIPKDSMKYMETYNASEGFFAIQNDPMRDDLLLMLDIGIYYEFVLADEVHLENPRVYSLEEVEVAKNYALIISTNAGLWRYIIGDTVMFTSINPFRIKITGRIKHFINAFGEELMIENAEKALKVACERTYAEIREYTAAPIYMDDQEKGAHEWVIEFSKNPTDIGHFTEILDNELKSLNSDYEAKRYKNMTLKMPNIVAVKEGTFYNWMKRKGKLGGQHKVPRLSNTREYIDEIMVDEVVIASNSN